MSKENKAEIKAFHDDLREIMDGAGTMEGPEIAKAFVAKGWRKLSDNVIEFPCKPGQTLWIPSEFFNIALPIYRPYFEIYEDEIMIYSDDSSEWKIEDIGKTIFLTREEAEQALAKKKGGK